ncbi:hypothetical protein GCM10029976_074450 [Kribbella albertanoniae]|uniref:UDP-N-acetylglucosamine kinase n=1 Tax=Kribbella albertanoniae TaxID=1266829 RepID=A0A4V2XPT8_9ACTN|nr:zeta toxin family protein [Kribbella albertanoniae]TDC23355.1 hypothetical protein E1261_28660 [Kribbella albertanoniae]
MSVSADLTPEEKQRAFADRLAQLTPRNPPNRAPGVQPRAMLLGGQPAAGKTTTQRLVHAALGPDHVASYDGDDNAAVHPRYDALRREHGIEGHDMASKALNNGDKSELHWASMKHLREGEPQYDVLASHPLAREEWAKQWVNGFKEQGYRVSVAYVATNHANSTIGLAERYQNGVDNEGGGRWLDPDLHDQFYNEMPDTAQALESEGLVDDIYVVDRDGNVLYENHRDADGNWEQEPAVKQAILDERDRPPTPEAHEYLTQTADRLLDNRDPSLPPLEPKVREAVERAVRREGERPAPESSNRGQDTSQRIDTRLAANLAAPARPDGIDEATWNAQRAATSGLVPAGSGAGSSADLPSRPTTGGQSQQRDTPGAER